MDGRLNDEEKVARTQVDADSLLAVRFAVGDQSVDAVLLTPGAGAEPADYTVGANETMDDQGNRTRRYLMIPKRLMESRPTEIKVFESHEKLKKGIEATAVLAGVVVVGSLFVRRLKKHR